MLESYMKAAAEGDGWSIAPRLIHRLNAPFAANWSDYPTVEELTWTLGGIFTRLFGIHAAYNLCVLSSHLLAGASFYLVARCWGSKPAPAWLGGLCFSASRFLLIRDQAHINVAFAWHVPLLWLGARLLWEGGPLERRHKLLLAFVSFVSAWQNPYYLYFWVLMIVPSLLQGPARGRWRQALPALTTLAWSAFCLLLCNLDTLLGWMQFGRSTVAFNRSIAALQLYGLRLPELLFPVEHRWGWLSQFSQMHYYGPLQPMIGESNTGYFGAIGVLCALAVTLHGTRSLLRSQAPGFVFAMSLWLVLVCLTGGLNLVGGVFGNITFRATARVCIVLLAGVLLEACRSSRALSARWRWAQGLVVPLGLLALWDQLPLRPDEPPTAPARRAAEDQSVIDQVVAARGARASVFQWPVQAYPEPTVQPSFPPYEPMGLFLLSDALRFSYGDCLGHWNSNWQSALNRLQPAELLAQVERYGFSACVLYPAALPDSQKPAWHALDARASFTPAKTRQLFLLNPPPPDKVELPPQLPAFAYGAGWHAQLAADGWHSSSGYGICGLVGDGRPVDVTFQLRSPRIQQTVEIQLNQRLIWTGSVGADPVPVTLHLGPLRRSGNELIVLGKFAPPPEPDGRWIFYELGNERFSLP